VLIEHLKSKRYGEKPQMIRRQLAEGEAGKNLTNDSSGEDTEGDTEGDNEKDVEEDIEEKPEGDSLIDREMESSSDDEESRSEEEKEESGLANANAFSVGGAKSLRCKIHQAH
jgi:hypothetical protein